MLEAALTNDVVVDVTLVQNSQISCGTHGGNLRVKSKNNANNAMKITWQWVGGGQEFRLQFQAIPLEGDVDSPTNTPYWPFTEADPSDGLGITTSQTAHVFHLKDTDFACKYSVIVGNLRLDPIIIVEKKR
jgi:hypothetical protein